MSGFVVGGGDAQAAVVVDDRVAAAMPPGWSIVRTVRRTWRVRAGLGSGWTAHSTAGASSAHGSSAPSP